MKTETKDGLIKIASHYGNLFLAVLSVTLILFVGYLFYAKSTLMKSQDEIKSSYSEHIQKADNIYLSILNYSKEIITDIQKANSAVVVDSLIRYSLGSDKALSKDQFGTLTVIISKHFEEINKLHQQYEAKCQKDSLLLSAERALLEGQTKNLIDLHLSKVEHEYSNITIWAALLTILFLVFSFYSISKLDDLIKQGATGVEEIKSLKKDGETEVDNFKKVGDKAIFELETSINRKKTEIAQAMDESIRLFGNKITDLESNSQNAIDELNSINKIFEQQSAKLIQEFRMRLDKKYEQIEDEYSNKMTELSILITKATTSIPIDEQESVSQQSKEETPQIPEGKKGE